MERHFEQELEEVRRNLLRMGGLVEQMIAESISALTDRSDERAHAVIAQDQEVDQLENRIISSCQQVLARQQPMAGDLRFLISVMQIANDLERIGDSAGNIGEAVLSLNQDAPLNGHFELQNLSVLAIEMVRHSLDAFVNRDSDLALKTWREDDQVDDLYKALFDDIVLSMTEDRAVVRRALQTLMIARNLERVADHASNICEDVIYYVTGSDIRHSRTVYEPSV